MRVLIEQELFGRPEGLSLPFLEIFALARDGRHTLLTKPIFRDGEDGPIAGWLNVLPEPVVKRVRLVFEQALQSAASLPSDTATITIAATTDWRRGRLTLAQAIRLLRMPLGLLLEHRRTDLRFLLALAPPTQRRQLQDALDAGWIEVLNGGGLGDMTALIEELSDPSSETLVQRARLMRLWVMFDRDSDLTDRARPSPNSERLKAICEKASNAVGSPWPLNHYQLGRRTIENYLPERLLRLWQQDVSGSNRTKRRKTIDALSDLRKTWPEAGHQYNMKHGLVGDLGDELRTQVRKQNRDVRDHELDPLFQRLSEQDRKALRDGFRSKIADLFDWDPGGYEDAFRAEFERGRRPDEPTREAILNSLFARL
ncbi:hypothetical protein [uncultured Thiodictyon sp.]|uniref:hypothetical protein n=1 Tax=uncultured Thiodictyon sp. TaxID=1846217 RepID=UPI0025FDB4F4|nr:hypothetical protein [uncultured Thiodictyon sp.]